jgi:hypothetical protein
MLQALFAHISFRIVGADTGRQLFTFDKIFFHEKNGPCCSISEESGGIGCTLAERHSMGNSVVWYLYSTDSSLNFTR